MNYINISTGSTKNINNEKFEEKVRFRIRENVRFRIRENVVEVSDLAHFLGNDQSTKTF